MRGISVGSANKSGVGSTISLLGGTALALMVTLQPALAQSNSNATESVAEEDATDPIVVTGLRESLRQARDIKRNSEQIVDSITAQDIGALPDRSVSEALQRIPGVTLQRTNENRDPARLAAEGGGVFVRGLSWVRSELNGRDIFSANNGRGLSFEDVSADLLGGVDVFKNPSADLVEGGIGGIVNLRTRKPLDQKRTLVAISGDYNYADLRQKGYFSVNGLFSKVYDTEIGEVGILVSGSLGNIGNRTDSIQTGRYDPVTLTTAQDGLAVGTTTYVPASLGWRRIDWEQRRIALNGALQWRTNNGMTFTLEGFYGRATPKDIEFAEGVYDLPDQDTSYQFNSETRALEGGTYRNANMDLNTRLGDQKKTTSDISLKWHYEASDNWTLSADVQRITSKAEVLSMTAFSQFGVATGFFNAQRPDITFDIAGRVPTVTTRENGASLADQSNYWWAAAMDHIEDNEADSWAQRADAEYEFLDNPFLKSFRFGARATQKDAITRQTGYNWGLLSQQFWGSGGGGPVFLDEAGTPPNPLLPSSSQLVSFENFYGGSLGVPGVGWFPSVDLITKPTSEIDAILQSTRTSGWGWTPLTEASYDTSRPAGDNISGGINTQSERTYAGYGMLRFGNAENTFDGNVGVRVIRTENDAIGVLVIGQIQNTMTPAACVAANGQAACQSLINALAFTRNGAGQTLEPYLYENNYTDVLPTLNLRYKLSDETQIRFAAGKAIVRPTFAQMQPYTTLGYAFRSDGFTPEATFASGFAGNPNLKPIKSTQFDFSVEHYWGRANSLTFAAFYKRIRDYIFAGIERQAYTNNGVTQEFQITRNINGAKGSIKGMEIGYQQFFDMLPGALSGLGIQGNYTFVDSNGGENNAVNIFDNNQIRNAADRNLPLEGLSKHSFNLAAMYEKSGVSARLAYNWRSTYLLTTSAANLNAPVWSRAYGQLDGSVLVNLNSQIKVGLQGTNLLKAQTYLDVGGAQLRQRYSWTKSDRRVAALVRASF